LHPEFFGTIEILEVQCCNMMELVQLIPGGLGNLGDDYFEVDVEKMALGLYGFQSVLTSLFSLSVFFSNLLMFSSGISLVIVGKKIGGGELGEGGGTSDE